MWAESGGVVFEEEEEREVMEKGKTGAVDAGRKLWYIMIQIGGIN